MKINDKTRESIFPTYVYHFDIEDYDDVLFKEVIKDHIVQDTSPLTLSKSDLHDDERLKDFSQEILYLHKDIMENMGYFPQDLEFSGMWGVEQNKYGRHRQHYHPNNWMCGVFYVDTDETDTLSFHDPRLRAGVIQPKTFKYNDYNTSILKYPAKSGRVYIFPHWLEHEVEPIIHDKTRVSISWNIRIPKLLGCGYGCTNG